MQIADLKGEAGEALLLGLNMAREAQRLKTTRYSPDASGSYLESLNRDTALAIAGGNAVTSLHDVVSVMRIRVVDQGHTEELPGYLDQMECFLSKLPDAGRAR